MVKRELGVIKLKHDGQYNYYRVIHGEIGGIADIKLPKTQLVNQECACLETIRKAMEKIYNQQ